jgi:hypothetical protein
MRTDFAYIQALQAKARRERSEAIYRMLVAPLIALLKRPAAPKPIRHAPRPHLARQG